MLGYVEYFPGDTHADTGELVTEHTCVDINECDNPSLFECVILSGCTNKNGSYACTCEEFLAPEAVDADGNPTACIDDDECTRPESCGPWTQERFYIFIGIFCEYQKFS